MSNQLSLSTVQLTNQAAQDTSAVSTDSPRNRNRLRLVIFIVLLLATLSWLGFYLVSVAGTSEPKHSDIQDLQTLPLGPVRLEGVITYRDSPHERFWLQDETGALAIKVSPRAIGLTEEEVVRIEATKSSQYNPVVGLESVALNNIRIEPVNKRRELPLPVKATLKTLPGKEKNGIRIEVEGVVQHASAAPPGYSNIDIGESGRELRVTVHSGSDHSRLINARVQVTGVIEAIHDGGGNLLDRHLSVNSDKDIEVIEPAPVSARLYDLRALYTDPESRNGHLVRFRGRVNGQLDRSAWLIEDRWGAVACRFDADRRAPIGHFVEVSGYPSDDLRIDLLHANAELISPTYSEEVSRPKTFDPVLTSAASVRSLSDEQAKRAIPVRITGVLTFVDSDWRQLFLQDSTGGIYVKYAGAKFPLMQGQRVTIKGLTNPGDYAPVIIAPKLEFKGRGELPYPIKITAHDALSGVLDSQFVEIDGVIHSINSEQNKKHLSFDVYSPFGQVHVSAGPNFGSIDSLRTLEDTRVRIRGVCGTLFNSRRQLVGFQLALSSIKDIQVLDRGNPDPFSVASVPIDRLLTFSVHSRFDHRIKVSGSITLLGPDFFYVQDETGGLKVLTDTRGLKLADAVAVVGYAEPGGYSPLLTDAAVRLLKHTVPTEVPHVTPEELTRGAFDSRMVTIDGHLLSIVNSFDSKTLVLDSGGRTFDAQLQILSGEATPEFQEGSMLRLRGICSAQVDPHATYLLLAPEAVGFTILVPSLKDVVILRGASWWNLRHTGMVLLSLLVAVLATFGWVMLLQQRIRTQTAALSQASDKARAIRELSTAMQDVSTQQDFSRRVIVPENDEIAPLAKAFNRMLSELRLRDIAKRKAEDKLQYQALTDELTGLPNRRLLSDRLAQTVAVAKREQNTVAVLYIDLDGFKLVNDSLGHIIGDVLLSLVAERLKERIRHSDTLARLGGDEFTVVLTNLSTRDDAGRVARSLLDVLAKPFFIESHEITIGASIGISIFPEHGTDAIDLLQQADSAMYTAKRNGKNQMVYYTAELGSLARERLSIENQLRGAIAREEISVHYQPEFDIATGRLIRFEALARWTHSTLGTISPGKFIPIAEESGLIVSLGAHIMERACAEAVNWQSLSPQPVQVAVNVSSLQFMRETFVEEVKGVLSRTGLAPRLLQIELTESVMLTGPERAAEIIKTLRSLGISVVIDDFGTGYSCFSYLPRLPFNALKIDRSFVKELDSRVETKAMIQSLVALAKNLSMQVIVEGIETPEQLSLIRKLGANEVQGYLLGKPTPEPAAQLCKKNPVLDFPAQLARN